MQILTVIMESIVAPNRQTAQGRRGANRPMKQQSYILQIQFRQRLPETP